MIHISRFSFSVDHEIGDLHRSIQALIGALENVHKRATGARNSNTIYAEDGLIIVPARDMKPALLHGPHSKISKLGTRYNTIPINKRLGITTYRTVTSNSPPNSWIYPEHVVSDSDVGGVIDRIIGDSL